MALCPHGLVPIHETFRSVELLTPLLYTCYLLPVNNQWALHIATKANGHAAKMQQVTPPFCSIAKQ
jgi:hypothetical protein